MEREIIIVAVLISIIWLSLAARRYYAAKKNLERQKELLRMKWVKFKEICKHL